MKSGIYKIQNQVNGKVYIGSGVIKERFTNHKSKLRNNKHDNRHLQNSWKKYGKDNFIFEVLIYCGKDSLGFYEERAIVYVYESHKRKNGYNFKIGRKDGSEHSEQTKRKISETLKEHYEKNDSPMKGSKQTEEAKRKISKNAGVSGEDHPFYGGDFSDQHRNNLSEALNGKDNPFYGKSHSEESVNKIKKNMPDFSGENNPFYGKKHDEEAKKKMRGEDRSDSKLSKSDVIEIKNKIKDRDIQQKKIADQYNVCSSLITQIKKEKIWGHIEI